MVILQLFIGVLLLGYGSCSTPSVKLHPEEQQYLAQLFQSVKDSGREPVNGELNLLPDEGKGFANVVRSFPDSLAQASSTVRESRREMWFDLHGFKTSEAIIELRLVLKRPTTTRKYTVKIYKIMEDGVGLKKLGSDEYCGEWFDLEVNDESHMTTLEAYNNKRGYGLAIEISSADTDLNTTQILTEIKPMLLVYVYDKDLLKQVVKSESQPKEHKANKRQAFETRSRNDRSLEEMGRESCQVQYRLMTYEQVGWPGGDITVIYPATLNFTFCYGHCTQPFTRGEEHKYTGHAKLMAISNPDLAQARLAPCCIPTSFSVYSVIFEEYGSIGMTSATHVTRCGCH